MSRCMYCIQCDKKIRLDAKFCEHCGKEVMIPEEWKDLCLRIRDRLELLRNEWFQQWLEVAKKTCKHGAVTNVFTPRLNLLMSSYQLVQVQLILSEMRYIAPEKGSDFVTLLWDYVCENNVIEGLEISRNYYDQKGSGRPRRLIASDIANEICSNEFDRADVMFVFPLFVFSEEIMVQMIIAETFGDNELVKFLAKDLDKYSKELKEGMDSIAPVTLLSPQIHQDFSRGLAQKNQKNLEKNKGEVVTYKNTLDETFSQIKLKSGERILVSIADSGVKIFKLGFGGLIPMETIWETNNLLELDFVIERIIYCPSILELKKVSNELI